MLMHRPSARSASRERAGAAAASTVKIWMRQSASSIASTVIDRRYQPSRSGVALAAFAKPKRALPIIRRDGGRYSTPRELLF